MKKIYLFTCLLLLCFQNLNAQIQTVGLFTHLHGSDDDGYVLFAPTTACDTTYLIDKCGKLVHKWASQYTPGLDVYLLPDGTLLRSGHVGNTVFDACNCGTGGIIERIDWDGNVIWHYIISDSFQTQSHDICYMPNGHILLDVWENVQDTTAIANGRKPIYLGKSLYSPKIIEIQPEGTDSATIVWSWRLWDHLVQDQSPAKPNFGIVSDHPELVNLNYVNIAADPPMSPDWVHLNSVVYNPTLDQIMISAHNFDEVWIIDHSTTTAAAATHSGGRYGKGGDLLYRWGNPSVYNMGTLSDTKFFQQHNATWITFGKYKDQIMVFNNGYGRPGGDASSVDIFNPPIDPSGNYLIKPTGTYGPDTLTWTYEDPTPTNFFTTFMGGCQLLPNGNVLMCGALQGLFIEVDTNKNTVWKYINPVDLGVPTTQGKTVIANTVYRCAFYPSSYTGFAGHSLVAGLPIELYPLTYSCDLELNTPLLTGNNHQTEIYPNPANTSLSFKLSDLRSAVLMDITGKTILFQRYNNSTSGEINTASLPDGVYILSLNGSEYKRIIIQH